jgi:hypothetical protein
MSNREKWILAVVVTLGALVVLLWGSGLHLTGWQGFWLIVILHSNRAQTRYYERARHQMSGGGA